MAHRKPTHVTDILAAETGQDRGLPLFSAAVPAGFPSPADDYLEGPLDLNQHLVKHPAATFFVRVSGDSMIEAGIHDGDILIVDRSLQPRDRSIVIAAVDGELTVKRIRLQEGRLELVPENADYAPRRIEGETALQIWGVVVHAIHSF